MEKREVGNADSGEIKTLGGIVDESAEDFTNDSLLPDSIVEDCLIVTNALDS